MINYYERDRKARNLVYTRMLDNLMKDDNYKATGCLRSGLCFLLGFGSMDVFPELKQYKPRRYYKGTTYWFNPYTEKGTDKRIVILLCAIMETL